MLYKFVGMWAVRRAYRLLTSDDPRPLPQRLGHEARRILLGAALTLGLVILGAILLVGVLIAVAT